MPLPVHAWKDRGNASSWFSMFRELFRANRMLCYCNFILTDSYLIHLLHYTQAVDFITFPLNDDVMSRVVFFYFRGLQNHTVDTKSTGHDVIIEQISDQIHSLIGWALYPSGIPLWASTRPRSRPCSSGTACTIVLRDVMQQHFMMSLHCKRVWQAYRVAHVVADNLLLTSN